ncbi:CPBP family intramembrane glutamic endopeptidase [Mumia quercus]|uniref:CPBP family intramembrane glutamic endopeptidase n=1 Tax=Mumia quercus TaxID=2976125 RepID=UPI0021CFA423|nr:CPBP family intramembrane glutamic endopeptidase [Mumia quercus]
MASTLAYAVALAVPASRDLLVDDRAPDSVPDLAVRVLLVIPLHTVLLEELVFRGVVQGMVRRDHGVRAAVVVSSVLFGLWHLGSAGAALDGNEAVAGTVGSSVVTAALGMLAIVIATGLAGVVLALARERSGSLLAPAGLHWAANAAGTVATYVASR